MESNGVKSSPAMKSRHKNIQIIFAVVAWLFALCVISQVFIAGLATFVDFSNWKLHTNFVHIFEWLPIIMFILTFFGHISKSLRWESLGLFGLIFLQYATANMGSVWVLGAFHTVIALFMFSWSISVARRAMTQ